jgi:peptidoglycan/xylan/chitin deacetylase (PgdA/CDA1 family)
MNTDRPTPAPQDSTSAEPATVDESAEPTVALSEPVGSGDGDGEPTVSLPAAETSEATVDVSSSPESEPTADLSAISPAEDPVSEDESSEPTVALSAAAIADAAVEPSAAEAAEETVPAEGTVTAEDAVAAEEIAASEEAPASEETAAAEETVALSTEEETVALSMEEETVALSMEEETVALSMEEETVALSAVEMAAADESEPTTVISAESEPTVALPRPRVSPESKVTLPAGRDYSPAPEPTIALPIPPRPAPQPTSESTVALPSVPAQRSAPTVAPPPSEPTIALPVAPGAPVVVPPQAKPLSRRRLLWAIPAVAGTALVGGTIAALAGRGEPEAAKTPNLVVSEPAPSQPPAPAPTAPRPTTPVMKFPVHTLTDFRKVVPGDPFPADAIALTIDDGPHPVWTPKILRLLEKHDVPALFCMIGNQVRGHEATARDVAADGHRIANHTWSHPIDLAELPAHKALKEIHRAQDKIYSTTGYAPSLFRAPGGAWSKGLSESVSQSGVIPMDWSADPRDWALPGVAHITNRLLAAQPGQILLCHDGGGDRSQTLASLKTVIPALQARGLKFVALM